MQKQLTGRMWYEQTIEAVRGRGNYFKAVRTDGCSFADSTFQYTIGETSTAPQSGTTLCKPGLLHVSDVPSETLIGGSWPCRLFEARGTIVAGFSGPHKSKGGAKSLHIVRELPAWMALGPNGRAAAAFVVMLGEVPPAAWPAARPVAWDAAWDATWAAARATRAAARDVAWAAAWAAARATARAAWAAAWAAARDATWAAAWDAAWDATWAAAWDAVGAIIAFDLITKEQFVTLYKPFAKVLPIADVRNRGVELFPYTGPV